MYKKYAYLLNEIKFCHFFKCLIFFWCFYFFRLFYFLKVVGSRGSVEVDPRYIINTEAQIHGIKLFAVTEVRLPHIHCGISYFFFYPVMFIQKIYNFYLLVAQKQ